MMSIYRSEKVTAGMRLMNNPIFVYVGRFKLLVTLIPTKYALEPKNLHLGSFSVHHKCLRVSLMMLNYSIMTAYINVASKILSIMFSVGVFGNATVSYLR